MSLLRLSLRPATWCQTSSTLSSFMIRNVYLKYIGGSVNLWGANTLILERLILSEAITGEYNKEAIVNFVVIRWRR
ncbi:MAG: hypothetical protein KatS3mg057_0508 [Herpetosiphonaceae bacterium]|nr:MAG: hypothetical protein KatS3mg057_0508 [Herpetosiphonaceae bacterium]